MDPIPLTQQDWKELHLIVNNIWLMLVCALSFSGNMLLAHAIIPSLVESGSVSKYWKILRILFYMGGFGSAALYIGLAIWAIIAGDVINKFWPNFWI